MFNPEKMGKNQKKTKTPMLSGFFDTELIPVYTPVHTPMHTPVYTPVPKIEHQCLFTFVTITKISLKDANFKHPFNCGVHETSMSLCDVMYNLNPQDCKLMKSDSVDGMCFNCPMKNCGKMICFQII